MTSSTTNMYGRTGFWKRSIKTKIGIALFIIIIGMLGLFGIELYIVHKSDRTKELEELSTTTISRLAEQLVLPVWEIDNQWVKKIIISEMRDKRIFAILVNGEGLISEGMKRDGDWQLISAQDDISGDYILKHTDIVRGQQKIGSVRLYITKQFMNRELRHEAERLSLMVIVFSIFCLFFLSWMLHKIVIQPINRTLMMANAIADGEYNQEINLTQQDEIGLLGKGLSSMQDKIRQREIERDRSESTLRQSEQRYRTLVETMSDGLEVEDENNLITYVNNQLSLMLEYPKEEIIGRPLSDFLDAANRKVLNKQMRQQAKSGCDSYELSLTGKDGRNIDALISPRVIQNEHGKSIGRFSVISDITERKRAEQELLKYHEHLEEQVKERTADLIAARDDAEAANRAKSIFLSNMSHELRTPLNAILGFSSLMRKDPRLATGLQQNLDIINRSGEHLLRLINDILDKAKIESGQMQLENSAFDLAAMVQDITDLMRNRAKERGLQLTIDQSSLFPRYIFGDEARLRQILINLMGNAIRYTKQGVVILRLGTNNTDKSKDLVIEVEDSGVGIAAENQQRIFDPFVQLGEHGHSIGTGLGLTITQQFVQMMGGTISLQSTPGKGSLFRVDLPLDEAQQSDISKSEQAEMREVAGVAPGQPAYRILVVEDQLDNQLLLSKLLEPVGFQLRIAENGARGVELFQSWHPHLILMDRRMPVMDGMEATRRIRELPDGKQVKIVAVTASAFEEQREEMLNIGMDDYVCKPFRAAEIYHCLSKHLGVEYIYQYSFEAPQNLDVTLTPQMLNSLPKESIDELKQALESLEHERIETVIQRVTAHDETLQQKLMHFAGNFDYQIILRLLQGNEQALD